MGWGGVADGVGCGLVFEYVDGGAKRDAIGIDFGVRRDDVVLECGEFECWECADVDLGFEWSSKRIWHGGVDVGHQRWGSGLGIDSGVE